MNTNKKNLRPEGLYIHIPFCISKCDYCGFYSEPLSRHDPSIVISAIIAEMDRHQTLDTIHTVYIGGGSPSCLSIDLLQRLLAKINNRCSKVEEFTVEVNPGQGTAGLLEMLMDNNVNRLSVGAQSFNDSRLKLLGRAHTVGDIYSCINCARMVGFANINLDLIFAVPHSTHKDWIKDLSQAIDTDTEHISAYSLSFEKGTTFTEALETGRIEKVDEAIDREMYESAIDILGAHGLKQYEISNFARKGFQCRHNLLYWTGRQYLGLGPAAGSFFGREQRLNTADINTYVDRINSGTSPAAEIHQLTDSEFACQSAVLNLRRRCGIILKDFEEQTGFDALKLFAAAIEENTNAGLIEISPESIRLTRKALGIADRVFCDFSAL